jgi:hypothetical protein
VAGGYDEEALIQQALEASKMDEDKVCPGYSEAIKLTGIGGQFPGFATTTTTTPATRAADGGVRGAGGAAAMQRFAPAA